MPTATATCRTCTRALEAPYRRSVAGVVVEGCVAEDHDGHVSDAWHLRPEAVRIRVDSVRRLAEILGDR